jgi:hypothetical protein
VLILVAEGESRRLPSNETDLVLLNGTGVIAPEEGVAVLQLGKVMVASSAAIVAQGLTIITRLFMNDDGSLSPKDGNEIVLSNNSAYNVFAVGVKGFRDGTPA